MSLLISIDDIWTNPSDLSMHNLLNKANQMVPDQTAPLYLDYHVLFEKNATFSIAI